MNAAALERLRIGQVLLAIFVISCSSAVPASAAIIGSVTSIKDPANGLPFEPPLADGALGSEWVSYKLAIQATAGELIQAVDVSITAQLHQKWTDLAAGGAYQPSGNSGNMTGADSHLLAPGGLFGSGPLEDNPGTGSPLSATNDNSTKWGVGTFLKGAWAVPGSAVSSLDLGYLVLPRGNPNFAIDVKVGDPDGNTIGTLHRDGGAPSVLVSGTGSFITNGKNMPSPADGTDFGAVQQGTTPTRTFSASDFDPFFVDPFPIPLLLGPATFTGPFSLVGTFPNSGFLGGPFTIGLNTSVAGTYTGSISFATNDPFNDPFTFALAARVVPEPASIILLGLGSLFVVVFGIRRGR